MRVCQRVGIGGGVPRGVVRGGGAEREGRELGVFGFAGRDGVVRVGGWRGVLQGVGSFGERAVRGGTVGRDREHEGRLEGTKECMGGG